MPWSEFGKDILQAIIILVLIFVLSAAVAAVVRGIRGK
jgi:hypothetical protein